MQRGGSAPSSLFRVRCPVSTWPSNGLRVTTLRRAPHRRFHRLRGPILIEDDAERPISTANRPYALRVFRGLRHSRDHLPWTGHTGHAWDPHWTRRERRGAVGPSDISHAQVELGPRECEVLFMRSRGSWPAPSHHWSTPDSRLVSCGMCWSAYDATEPIAMMSLVMRNECVSHPRAARVVVIADCTDRIASVGR